MNDENIQSVDEINIQKYLDTGFWMMIIIGFSYGLFYVYLDRPSIAVYAILHGLLAIILSFYKKIKINIDIPCHIIVGIALEFTFGLNFFLIKTLPILSVYFCVVPVASLLLLGQKKSKIWIFLSILLLSIILLIGEKTSVDIGLNSSQILMLNTFQSVTIFIMFMVFIYLYEKRKSSMIDSLSLQNEEVLKAKNQLEITQKYKDNFLSSISHEIRTPMNAIKGISELLEHSACGKVEQELITALNNSSVHLLNIINDLLDLGKLEEKKLNILSLDIDLRETINIGTKMVQFAANEKKIGLDLNIDENLPKYIKGDPHRLNQIVVNILNNAVKFTKVGKVVLNVTKKNIDNIDWMELEISDTGIGIAKESYGLIFERFKQSNDYISLKFGGTGLGLNIVKGLVELMHGTISFESELGVGTTFYVQLPLIPSMGKHLLSSDSDITHVTGVDTIYNILLVDDNNLNLLVAEKLLLKEFENIKIYKAVNGQEAIAMLSKNPEINIVLMDLQMPIMDGKEATKRIRKMEDFKDIPIIAMSAAISSKEIEECEAVGMNDFIGKPFDKNSLVMLIRKHYKGNKTTADKLH